MSIVSIPFTTYSASIREVLDQLRAGNVFAKQTQILIKPNLVNASPHPITTPPACCEAIVQFIKAHSDARIIIGEGCGDSVLETDQIFDELGYREMVERYSVELVDLNHAPLRKLRREDCLIFPTMMLPEIVFESYLISVPVLKAHSLAKITGTLKNMMGIAPPKYYSGKGGVWKKAIFHQNMQQSIFDLNQYRTPDLSIMDATIGMAEFHLGGRSCDPPLNRIVAGFNAKRVDREAAAMLNFEIGRAHV